MDITTIKDALNRSAEAYTLDAQGRVKTVTNMEGQTATINYLCGPLVASITRFDGNIVGLPTSVADTTSQGHDVLGRRSSNFMSRTGYLANAGEHSLRDRLGSIMYYEF